MILLLLFCCLKGSEILWVEKYSINVTNVHPHRCRRTMATELARKGMPIQYVQQILGHAKLDTTMIYCICDKKNVRNEFNKVM